MSQGAHARLEAKRSALSDVLQAMERVAVAFSGGTDSAYLLAACIDALGADNVVAYTVDSPLLPREELVRARRVAEALGAQHRVLAMDELALPEIVANDGLRCYHCKRHRFEQLRALLGEVGHETVLVHGENADDAGDYRPGARAAHELGVRAPLAEVGLSKAEIRELSRQRGLETWDLPAAACLASRVPYGTPLSLKTLQRIQAAEAAVVRLTRVRRVRVRDHFPLARIEVSAESISDLSRQPVREQIVEALLGLGYRYVTLDLAGYRMGSLNDELGTSEQASASE